MKETFIDIPEALDNTIEIVSKIDDLKLKKDIGYDLNFEIRTNIEMDLDPIIDKILNVVDDENVTYFDLITVIPKV